VSPQGIRAYSFTPLQTPQTLLDQARQRAEAGSAPTAAAPNSSTISFKQLVERAAEEKGILFMPLPLKHHEGKQVYRFANLTVYLDRAVVFVFNNSNNTWVPTPLDNLLDSAT
jgi:hypothetical protein